MTRFPKAVRKYLETHAEPEAAWSSRVRGRWAHVLTVPARRETAEFLDDAEPAARAAGRRVLVIVVVNGVAGDDATARANRELIEEVRARCSAVLPLASAMSFLGRAEALDVLLVDRASGGVELPARSGVGLARKIAGDLALALWADGRIESPWIHCSDGDAAQPDDRFSVPHDADVVAWTHPFVHEPGTEPEVNEALRLYDLSLRYYVEGLRWAGSPWAWFAVGSTITVHAGAYAAVRGYPAREAAEDFHLLAKLAKIGRVATPPTGPVRLRARTSDRVPFGTGAAVTRIRAETERGETFRLYDPVAFRLLRVWLTALDRDDPFDPSPWSGLDAAEAGAMEAALDTLGARDRFASSPRAERRDSFDALRTLRFVHAVTDHGFPRRPWREAIQRAEDLRIISSRVGDHSHVGKPSAGACFFPGTDS